MKNLTAFVKSIADTIKKNVDIMEGTGYVMFSSDERRVGMIIQGTEEGNSMSLDDGCKYYVYIDGGSCEETALAALVLKDKISQGTADSYQQFLINILDGQDVSEEYCNKFNIPKDESYVVYGIILNSNEHFSDAYTLIQNSFYEEEGVWVFPFKYDIVLLERAGGFSEHTKSNARTIKDMINSEAYADVFVGVGNIHRGIKGIRKSFSEAKEAIKIGRLFNLPENIYIYKDMLPERIVNMIPRERAEALKNEFFKGNMDDVLDSEMIKTVEVLFKNNLNISDSSRILYIHRNTLLYRLDKIQKATGLDIKKFQDAVILKLVILLKVGMKK